MTRKHWPFSYLKMGNMIIDTKKFGQDITTYIRIHIPNIILLAQVQSFQVEGPQDREISLFLRIKIGRFFKRELFNALPKTIGIRNDLRTVVLWHCLLFILAPRLNRTLSNQAMTMALLCLTMSARAKLRCRRRLGCFLFNALHLFCNIIGYCTKKTR